MNPVEPERRSRDVLTRLHGVRPLNLRRALDQARCQIVSPASSTAEPLHLEQKGLASPQRIFGHLSVVDVGPDAIPTRLAVVVVYPHGPNLEPSILAVARRMRGSVSNGCPACTPRRRATRRSGRSSGWMMSAMFHFFGSATQGPWYSRAARLYSSSWPEAPWIEIKAGMLSRIAWSSPLAHRGRASGDLDAVRTRPDCRHGRSRIPTETW